MAQRTTARKSEAKAAVATPALHALAVAPVVGGIVALLVAVGIAATAFGAFSGFASSRSAKRLPRPGRH